MRTPPTDLPEAELLAHVGREWGLRPAHAEYMPVGWGTHHWRLRSQDGREWWLNLDDLDRKEFLGADADTAFTGLRVALDTARALRDGGLEFVLAPLTALSRVGGHYAMALYPYTEGYTAASGNQLRGAQRDTVLRYLARLHGATMTATCAGAREWPLQPVSRPRLEAALANLHDSWLAGPHGESARELVARHEHLLHDLLVRFDRLAATITAAKHMVVTHGEPHTGNVLWANSDHAYFIDWDTVGLAPPERDLWLLASGAGEDFAVYEALTGTRVDPVALELYRLRWWLDDTAICTNLLRSPHAGNDDAAYALLALETTLTRAAAHSVP